MNNVTADSGRAEGRLTGEERFCRAGACFLWTLAAAFLLAVCAFWGRWMVPWPGLRNAVGGSLLLLPLILLCSGLWSLFVAVVAGGIVAVYSRRRVWHEVFAVVAAVLASVWVMGRIPWPL